jgi:hypothetical protein
VLDRVTVNALGSGGLEFRDDGVVWTCIIKAEHLVGVEGTPKSKAPAASAPTSDVAVERRRAS